VDTLSTRGREAKDIVLADCYVVRECDFAEGTKVMYGAKGVYRDENNKAYK
jgi:hypothetical protein